jgi:acyl transferase domain-containing protein
MICAASAVVIKRHDLAVRDMNHIHATLAGTALTSCGSIMGSLTTPSAEAQASAIRNAYRDAGLEPHQGVSYKIVLISSLMKFT